MRLSHSRSAGIIVVVMTHAALAECTQVRRLTTHDADDRHPQWSPDGTRLAFETDRHGHWDLYLRDAEGPPRRLTTDPAADRYPSWDPSGTKIVFASDRTGAPELHVYNLRTNSVSLLLSLAGEELFPAWSPDGMTIAFTRLHEGRLDLYAVQADGSGLRRLTASRWRDVWPRWSADGERLVFFSRRDTEGIEDDLYTLDLATGSITRLTTDPGHDAVPAWAPDGDRVAYVRMARDGTRELRVLDTRTRLSTPVAGVHFARLTELHWHPTEPRLAFAAQSDGRYDVYVVRVDGM